VCTGKRIKSYDTMLSQGRVILSLKQEEADVDKTNYSISRLRGLAEDIEEWIAFLEDRSESDKRVDTYMEESASISVAVENVQKMTKEHYEGKTNNIVGLATGFKDLDIMTGGLSKGEVTVIAGRPSMGKTALVLSILRYVSIDSKTPCGYLSLEMSKDQLAQRMLCSIAHVNAHKVRTGFLSQTDWPKLVDAAQKLSEAPIFIDDTQALSPGEMEKKLRDLKYKHNIQFAVVDYLQCTAGMSVKWANDYKMTVFTALLKKLARELDITIIVLSQLPRSVEERSDHRPYLSDLREYGDMVNMVDRVLLLYREEYYEPTETNRGQAEIIVAKQRRGPFGCVRVKFLSEYTKFVDLADHEGIDEF